MKSGKPRGVKKKRTHTNTETMEDNWKKLSLTTPTNMLEKKKDKLTKTRGSTQSLYTHKG